MCRFGLQPARCAALFSCSFDRLGHFKHKPYNRQAAGNANKKHTFIKHHNIHSPIIIKLMSLAYVCIIEECVSDKPDF